MDARLCCAALPDGRGSFAPEHPRRHPRPEELEAGRAAASGGCWLPLSLERGTPCCTKMTVLNIQSSSLRAGLCRLLPFSTDLPVISPSCTCCDPYPPLPRPPA